MHRINAKCVIPKYKVWSCLQKGKVVTFKRHCGEDITMFICTLSVLASLNWHYGGAGHDADSFLSRDVFQTHER